MILDPDERLVPATKMTEEERFTICEKLGQFWPIDEIVRWGRREFKKNLHRSHVLRYKKSSKWQPLIQNYRRLYTEAIADIPLAHRRVRLERLERQYQAIVISAGSEMQALKNALARREMRVIISQAADEVSEKTVNLTQVYATQINQLSDQELSDRIVGIKQQLAQMNRKKLSHTIETLKTEEGGPCQTNPESSNSSWEQNSPVSEPVNVPVPG